MQQRGVIIVVVHDILGGMMPEFISRAVGVATFETASAPPSIPTGPTAQTKGVELGVIIERKLVIKARWFEPSVRLGLRGCRGRKG